MDDGFAVDGHLLPPGGIPHGGRGNAVGVSERALGVLVDFGDGVDREEVALGAGGSEAMSQVLARIGEAGLVEREAVVDA